MEEASGESPTSLAPEWRVHRNYRHIVWERTHTAPHADSGWIGIGSVCRFGGIIARHFAVPTHTETTGHAAHTNHGQIRSSGLVLQLQCSTGHEIVCAVWKDTPRVTDQLTTFLHAHKPTPPTTVSHRSHTHITLYSHKLCAQTSTHAASLYS